MGRPSDVRRRDPSPILQPASASSRLAVAEVLAQAAFHGRRAVGGIEQLGRETVAVGLEQSKLAAFRQAARAELRVVEDAVRPHIGALQQRLVDPLEVEGERERVADRAIGEHRLPRVEDHREHAGGPPVRQQLDRDAAILDGGEVIAGRPPCRRELLAQVVFARPEGLHHHFIVAIVVVADVVEIVQPAVYRQVPPPVVGIAAIDDAAARVDALDLVGAAAERRCERRLFEGH